MYLILPGISTLFSRQRESIVMKFCFNKLGIPVIGEVQNPGKLEGGDFFPLGKDFCMVGVGMISFHC